MRLSEKRLMWQRGRITLVGTQWRWTTTTMNGSHTVARMCQRTDRFLASEIFWHIECEWALTKEPNNKHQTPPPTTKINLNSSFRILFWHSFSMVILFSSRSIPSAFSFLFLLILRNMCSARTHFFAALIILGSFLWSSSIHWTVDRLTRWNLFFDCFHHNPSYSLKWIYELSFFRFRFWIFRYMLINLATWQKHGWKPATLTNNLVLIWKWR